MNKQLILIFLFALLNFQQASAYLGQLSKEFQDDTFTKDALSSWTLEGVFKDVAISNCGGKTIAGGYNVAGNGSMSKKFTSSEDILNISFSFELYLIDWWNNNVSVSSYVNNNQFQVLINDQVVHTLGGDYMSTIGQMQHTCGRTDMKDKQTRVTLTVPVNAKEFTIKFKGNYEKATPPDDQSWGIRNLFIYSDDGQGYQIVANELNDDNFDTSKWSFSASQTKTTICGKQIFGGYNIAGASSRIWRTFEKLPAHSFITFSFQAYFIDSWDRNDSIIVYLDGKMLHEQGKLRNGEYMCGSSQYGEYIQKLVLTFPHTASSAGIEFYLNLDQSAGDESFGFRDFQVYTSSPCPIIYSESNGQGKNYQFCGDIPNLKNIGWTQPIKGIYVPEGRQITVYKNANYNGQKYTIKSTDLNLSGENFVFVNQAFNIDVVENKLKRNV